jgi:hypothetical protein
MPRIGLIGCVKRKRSAAAPAAELYLSALFAGRRRAVEATCDRWYVLSAAHGLVAPNQLLEPYDVTLNAASRPERRRWSAGVLADLQRAVGPLAAHTFEIHAGAAYCAFGLVDGLRQAGATVELPTAGLPIGRQLHYYAETPR